MKELQDMYASKKQEDINEDIYLYVLDKKYSTCNNFAFEVKVMRMIKR